MFQINNTAQGVNAVLTGFKSQELEKKIQDCQDGNCSCECDPEIMSKIEDISFSSSADSVTINVKGNIDAQTLAPLMQECLIDNKE